MCVHVALHIPAFSSIARTTDNRVGLYVWSRDTIGCSAHKPTHTHRFVCVLRAHTHLAVPTASAYIYSSRKQKPSTQMHIVINSWSVVQYLSSLVPTNPGILQPTVGQIPFIDRSHPSIHHSRAHTQMSGRTNSTVCVCVYY